MKSIIKTIPAMLYGLLVLTTNTVMADINFEETWLISNARIVDGTGTPGYDGALRIKGGVIKEIGNLSPLPGEHVVDATGKILAPGFIDTHSHADSDLFELPDALPATSQGITTAIVGQDGSSEWPLSEFFQRLEREPVAL